MPIETLVVHKGHPFDYSTFFAMFDENPDVNATAVEQPAAQVMLRPENVAPYETVVFYDMWGTESPDGGASFTLPSDDYKASIAALVESGKGIVMMNHALVQWPSWEGWRDMSGTSFMLTEGEVFGELAAFDGHPRSANVRAQENCVVLCISCSKFVGSITILAFWSSSFFSRIFSIFLGLNRGD